METVTDETQARTGAERVSMTDRLVGATELDTGGTDRVRHAGFVELREPGSGKLLMRLQPRRALIQIRHRGVETLIDLTRYGLVYCGHPDGGFV